MNSTIQTKKYLCINCSNGVKPHIFLFLKSCIFQIKKANMSRGVRDLRELICVSRLTCHDSEEEFLSDENGNVDKELIKLKHNNDTFESTTSSPTSVTPTGHVVSPDSGCVTNGSTSSVLGNDIMTRSDSFTSGDGFFLTGENGNTTPTLGEEKISVGTAKFKSQKKKRKKRDEGLLPLEPTRHELPKAAPLPPVKTIPGSPIISEKDFQFSSQKSKLKGENEATKNKNKVKTRVNFDDMLMYMDATIVAGWLTRCNESVEKLSQFCLKGDNFVKFAHFWLSDFPDIQKRDIFAMEFDFLLEEYSLAFAVGRENRTIVRRDILDMCGAVFKEYPVKLLGAKGPHLFLDYLDILSSERHDQYRKLLSDVRCSTSNRQYAQWLLATRSLALVNVWTSILNFYQNLVGDGLLQGNPIHDLWSSNESVHHRRMLQAIRLGYIDVIHYLIVNGHVSPEQCDSHRRTLVFSAVMHNQQEVVKYLIGRVHPVIEINKPADTGNTALHAAANNGNAALVEILCECDGIDVNCVNPQCENATPLQLAVMHGHAQVVEVLLKHGADPSLQIGDTTLQDLARDFDHLDILDLLEAKT